MKALRAFVLLLAACVAIPFSTAPAEERSVVKGRVSDVDGRAVEGARVFVYDSPEVRRTADFMSAPTGKDGLFRLVVPAGKYWLVARLKKAEGYGPLMPGDKHSGEPAESEIASDGEINMDFVVADLKEAMKMRTKSKDGPVRISGRIIDENGSPVTGAYAIANRKEGVSGIPDYLSAWVDNEGRYTIYVPRGKYYLGGALMFPPGQDYFTNGVVTVDADKSDMDIVRKPRDSK